MFNITQTGEIYAIIYLIIAVAALFLSVVISIICYFAGKEAGYNERLEEEDKLKLIPGVRKRDTGERVNHYLPTKE